MGWPQYFVIVSASVGVLWGVCTGGPNGFVSALCTGFGQWVLYMGDFYA